MDARSIVSRGTREPPSFLYFCHGLVESGWLPYHWTSGLICFSQTKSTSMEILVSPRLLSSWTLVPVWVWPILATRSLDFANIWIAALDP